MPVNKVSHVTTIDRVAKDLCESEDWLFDVATEMDTEDGVIWSMEPERTPSWLLPTSVSRT
jgi:hypothetical protein